MLCDLVPRFHAMIVLCLVFCDYTFAADTSDAAASFLSNEMYVCASNRACTYVLISGFGGMYMGGMPGMGMDGGELLQRRTYSHTIINVLVF